jgi:Mycothiol maleylpyruvate isomerase N-terminal domain
MSIDRGYIAQNDAERARLRALVNRLSDAELAHPMPAGWTVASVLSHLAFWDQRILILLESWERAGLDSPPPGINEGDVEWVNDAAKPMFLALAPRRAAELALAIAEAVDRKVASLPDAWVAKNAAAGTPLSLVRAAHREEHLQEIEEHLRR